MPEKAHYSIGDEKFANKADLKARCQKVIASIVDGEAVHNEDLPFLMELFRHHDEWTEKSSMGIKRVTAQRTEHGTRCFVLVLADGSTVDISFNHAIKCLRGERTRELLPQKLVDYKNAARSTVTADIRAFRDAHLALGIICPFSKELITRENCQVDHEPPLTFDRLLYDFTVAEKISPLEVSVRSRDGTVPYFEKEELAATWIDYHRLNAQLRLLSTIGHAQVTSPRIDWTPVIKREEKI